ncbi:MAG: hypothetical protein QE265_04865 [Rhodoferax sp.]|nr:hypothetical protein [Rhodoferax sp.]
MTNRTYVPQANSLPSLVVGFFTLNPEEELTLEDISSKFSCTRNNIHTQLSLATKHGLLVQARNEDGDYIYRAGPALAKPSKAAPQTTAPKDVRTRVPLPKPADVVIEDNVPLPGRKKEKTDWSILLRRMAVGQSASLPLAAKYTLVTAITTAHKTGEGTYTTRSFSDQQKLRVWRVA